MQKINIPAPVAKSAEIEEQPSSYTVYPGRAASVTYEEIARAALALLRSGQRPSQVSVRKSIGHGSPNTITTLMERFWKTLADASMNVAPAPSSMPAEVLRLTEQLWSLAQQRAHAASTRKRSSERLSELKEEASQQERLYAVREKELQAVGEARLKELAHAQAEIKRLRSRLNLASRKALIDAARVAELQAVMTLRRPPSGALKRSAPTKKHTAQRAPRTTRRSRKTGAKR